MPDVDLQRSPCHANSVVPANQNSAQHRAGVNAQAWLAPPRMLLGLVPESDSVVYVFVPDEIHHGRAQCTAVHRCNPGHPYACRYCVSRERSRQRGARTREGYVGEWYGKPLGDSKSVLHTHAQDCALVSFNPPVLDEPISARCASKSVFSCGDWQHWASSVTGATKPANSPF